MKKQRTFSRWLSAWQKHLTGCRQVLPWILMGLFMLLACGGEGSKSSGDADSTSVNAEAGSENGAENANGKTNEKAIKVDVAAVRQGDLVIPIFADGVIRTPRSVQIRTKVAGELVKVSVEDGDRVTSGQLLAQIDQREYILALEESRYRHFQALAQAAAEEETLSVNGDALAEFTRRHEEIERLHRQRKMSEQEYRTQLLNLQISALQGGAFRQEMFEQRTGLGEARLAEERAQLNLENTEIRAPFAGIVEGLNVVRGEIVSVNTPICTIVNNDRLEASVNVLESDLGNLVEGRPALLGIPATGDTIRTHVDVISPLLDDASRTCQVLLRFDNPDGRFRPGMFVRAEIAGWVHPGKLLVPKPAVLTRDDRPLVFKVNEDQAQWLYIETGLENDRWVEIVNVFSGGSLAPGDRVVVSDHLTLAHEAKIRIRRTRALEDRWGLESDASS